MAWLSSLSFPVWTLRGQSDVQGKRTGSTSMGPWGEGPGWAFRNPLYSIKEKFGSERITAIKIMRTSIFTREFSGAN